MLGAPAAAPLAAAAAPCASSLRARTAGTATRPLAPCRAAPRTCRRAAVTVHAAASGPGGGGDGGGDGRRALLLALASVAIAVPVSKELVQDLGRGIDEEGSRMVRTRSRACTCVRGRRVAQRR
jgi:hypothetical protein